MKTIVGKDIDFAIQLLKSGELVAIPTETVYGLAANALDSIAVAKIFEAKNRPTFNPLIIHLPNFEAVKPYVSNIPDLAVTLANAFSPGPISFLLPKSSLVPDIVTAGSEFVVVRIPNHPLTLELLNCVDFPLAAPSANPFGYVSPVNATHVYEGLSSKIPYILDGGDCSVGLESTIVGFENNNVIIHRLGGVSVEDIYHCTGKMPVLSLLHRQPQTPGQLKSHYAPKTPLYLGDVENNLDRFKSEKLAVISLKKLYKHQGESYVLSRSGNLAEAAAQLFTVLREIDNSDSTVILAEKFPDEGLGKAINDRLERAGS
jgi:L-threonylcarbamoyladenylate synthase